METLIALMSALGLNGIMLFLVKRYFGRRDKARADDAKAGADLRGKIENALETIRLLSYARMSQEIERLLDQGYATPAERMVLDEMFANYKAHGWNGDMDARLEKVYRLRTDRPDE